MSLWLLQQQWVLRGRSAASRLLRALPGAEGMCVWVDREGTDCPQVTSLQPLILAVNLEDLPNFAEVTIGFLAR